MCQCKARTEDDCQCRICDYCEGRFEDHWESNRICLDCLEIEANEDLFEVVFGSYSIANATLLEAILLSLSVGIAIAPSNDHELAVGDLWFIRQHDDGFERHLDPLSQVDLSPYLNGLPRRTNGLPPQMVGRPYSSGHNYLPGSILSATA